MSKRVPDHHKGWQLLRIAQNALAKELVLPFVRRQLSNYNSDLNVVNFVRFISRDAKNPSYLLIAELTFEIIDMYIEYEPTRALKTTTVPFHELPVFITTLERE